MVNYREPAAVLLYFYTASITGGERYRYHAPLLPVFSQRNDVLPYDGRLCIYCRNAKFARDCSYAGRPFPV